VQRVYDNHRTDGLEIVGISFDWDVDDSRNGQPQKSLEQFNTFLSNRGISWPQFYDGKGWESRYKILYHVNSIPRTIVLGCDGRIALDSVDEKKLESVVQRLLKECTAG
jgi:hypothetical protein